MLMWGVIREAAQVLVMPCRRHTELISRNLDDPLPWLVRAALRVHFLGCTPCRVFARQLKFLRQATQMMRERSPQLAQPRMPEAVRERLRDRLRRS
jgi:hypothetical protein